MGDYDNDWLELSQAAEVFRAEGVARAVYQWDTTLLPDGYYVIRAVVTDSAGTADGPFSEEYEYRTLLVNNNPSVPAPANLRATVSETDDPDYYAITLAWECSAPDVFYEIYWIYNGQWTHLTDWSAPPGSISCEQWVKPAITGYTYHFKVRAVDYAGVEGEFTPEITVNLPQPPLPTPQNLAASPGVGFVNLSWDTLDIDNSSISYRVYRAVSGSVDFAPIGSVPHRKGYPSEYRDYGVAGGQTYVYKVKATAPNGRESPFSNEAVATPQADTTPPNTPHLEAQPESPTCIELSWSGDEIDQVVAYAVYRSVSAEGPFVLLATLDGSTYTYRDAGLNPNTTYYYYVLARDAAGNWSAQPDTPVSVTTPKPFDNFSFEEDLTGWQTRVDTDPIDQTHNYHSCNVITDKSSHGSKALYGKAEIDRWAAPSATGWTQLVVWSEPMDLTRLQSVSIDMTDIVSARQDVSGSAIGWGWANEIQLVVSDGVNTAVCILYDDDEQTSRAHGAPLNNYEHSYEIGGRTWYRYVIDRNDFTRA